MFDFFKEYDTVIYFDSDIAFLRPWDVTPYLDQKEFMGVKDRWHTPILRDICAFNPFTYAVELTRFALYGRFEAFSALVVLACAIAFVGGAIIAYDPSKGIITRVRAGAPMGAAG